MIKRVSAQEARERFAELASEVRSGGDPVLVEEQGQPLVVLIDPADLADLEQVRDRRKQDEFMQSLVEAAHTAVDGRRAEPLDPLRESTLSSTEILTQFQHEVHPRRSKDEWDQLLGPLHALSNDGLWRLASRRLTEDEADRLEDLVYQHKTEGLTETEIEEMQTLLAVQSRLMVYRARALALLQERGNDITPLLSAV